METAAHLSDHVLPPLPLRQWVLCVPKRLRYFLHDEAALLPGLCSRRQRSTARSKLRTTTPCSAASAADLDYVTGSRAASAALAENYVGLLME